MIRLEQPLTWAARMVESPVAFLHLILYPRVTPNNSIMTFTTLEYYEVISV